MTYAVYLSVVSKIGTVVPLFGKAVIDMALRRGGYTPESISPVEMLGLIKSEIDPALAARLQPLHTVLNAGVGFAQADHDDRIVQANSAALRLAGLGSDALPSSEAFRRLCGQGLIRPAHEVRSLEIREFHSGELGRDFSVSLCPVQGGIGLPPGVLSIISDVTVRKAIDDDIIRAEAELRNIIKCSADSMVVVDRAGNVVRANPATAHLYGIPEEGLRGRAVEALFHYLAPLPGGLMGMLEAHDALRDLDARLLPARGRSVPVLLSGAALRDKRGEMTGGVLSAKDMRHTRALLGRVMSSSKMAALGEMATRIGHEINNPLTVIQGKASQLRRMADRGWVDPSSVRSFAEKIEGTSQRIAQIVRGLHAFAQGGERERLVPLSVAPIIDDTIDLCRERYRASEVELRCGPVDPTLRAPCRATQLSQVILNLLTNALDAVAGGARPRWVAVTAEGRDDEVEIAVVDSGPGVSADLRERLFQPFFTTKSIGRGSGLGLSISQEIIHDHRGSLLLDEQSPHTRFVIRLPRARG